MLGTSRASSAKGLFQDLCSLTQIGVQFEPPDMSIRARQAGERLDVPVPAPVHLLGETNPCVHETHRPCSCGNSCVLQTPVGTKQLEGT